jgi:hypothetical protein
MVVGHMINCLTKDDDLRQDLWVHYLSGNPVDSLSAHLEDIVNEYSDEQYVKSTVWQLMTDPPSDDFIKLLDSFTEFEKSIICGLMLGFTIEHISQKRSMCEVRLRQTISSIRYNPLWENYHGIKNKPNSRRKTRSHRRRD